MTPPLSRGLSGRQLMKLAKKLGYLFVRESGSHIILAVENEGRRHICIPDHKALSVGTLNEILNEMARQLGMSKKELTQTLFG